MATDKRHVKNSSLVNKTFGPEPHQSWSTMLFVPDSHEHLVIIMMMIVMMVLMVMIMVMVMMHRERSYRANEWNRNGG